MDKAVLQRYEQSVKQAEHWLLEHLQEDGSFKPNIHDLCAYHKAPFAFFQAGQIDAAHRVLAYIKQQFEQKPGFYATSMDSVTTDTFLKEFPCVPQAWIAMSAQMMGQFDISFQTLHYLRHFYHAEVGAFATLSPIAEGAANEVDVYTTAQLGLMSLYFGDLNKAKRAGNFLIRCLSIQPDIHNSFYLHLNEEGRFMTAFSNEEASFSHISVHQTNEGDFILGLIMLFLGKLYIATQDQSYLSNARAYLGFLRGCDSAILGKDATPMIARGVTSIATITKDEAILDIAFKTTDAAIENFSKSLMTAESSNNQMFDEVAEYAICVKKIHTELSNL